MSPIRKPRMLKSSLLRLALALSLAGVGLSPAVAAPTGMPKPELASSATGIETVAYHEAYPVDSGSSICGMGVRLDRP